MGEEREESQAALVQWSRGQKGVVQRTGVGAGPVPASAQCCQSVDSAGVETDGENSAGGSGSG